jgi:hypothetical protein
MRDLRHISGKMRFPAIEILDQRSTGCFFVATATLKKKKQKKKKTRQDKTNLEQALT